MLAVAFAMHPQLTRGLFTAEHLGRLEAFARIVDREPLERLDTERSAEVLAEVDALITSWGEIALDEAALALAPKLKAVFHTAGTVKGTWPWPPLMSEAAWDRGIRVVSAAAANAVPVAEFTLAAILFSNKKVLRLAHRYREARDWQPWTKVAPDLGNYRKTVGVIGASKIGRLVIELLQPHDLDVVVSDPFLSPEAARGLGATLVELDDLMARSDVVTLHAPQLPSTEGMINSRRLALMKDGATFVNTARGSLVDHDALVAELVAGRIDAVIDTTEPEVLPADSPLYDLPNVLLTPHIAGSMAREVHRMADLVVAEVERFAKGEPLRHEVRREELDRLA